MVFSSVVVSVECCGGCVVRKLALGSIALVALGAGSSVLAADMPPTYKAPAYVVPVWSWSGFYAGVSGGYARLRATNIPISGDAATTASQGLGNVPFSLNSPADDGWLIGGQIGFNRQINSLVLGIEADLSYVDGVARSVSTTQGPAVVTTQFSDKLDYFGTIRGRVGLAVDRSLWYATGGLAYGNVKSSAIIFPGPGVVGPTLAGSDSNVRFGWTIGGGIEFALVGRWSVKAEYLHYDLGSEVLNIATVSGGAPQTATFNHDTKGHIVRVGLNYQFSYIPGEPMRPR